MEPKSTYTPPQRPPRTNYRRIYPTIALLTHTNPPSKLRPSSARTLTEVAARLPLDDAFGPESNDGKKSYHTKGLASCDCSDPRLLLAGVPNATVVEVGAFVGDDTIAYAKVASKVYTYEPGPKKVDLILKKVQNARNNHQLRPDTTVIIR